MKHSYVLSFVYETLWAILPHKMAAIREIARRHAAGEHLDPAEVAAITAARRDASPRASGAVAVIPILGTIIPRGDLLMESSGAVSTQRIAAMLRQALADPQVGSIVFDVDSPGGSVQGVEELANEIHAARGQKPMTMVANHLMASAAYWIGAAADELVVSPSSEVGSIGVFAAHEDWSRALDAQGVTVNLIAEGKYKVEGNPYQPLTDEARAAIKARVSDYYTSFVKAVARGRGVGVDVVRDGFGEGRVVGAREAVKLGMADRVATLDDVIAGQTRAGRRGMSADTRQRRLRLAQDS